jgi:YggT family protein
VATVAVRSLVSFTIFAPCRGIGQDRATEAAVHILARIIDGYTIILIISAVLSWVNLPPDNPVVKLLAAVTEPVLEPVRRLLPSLGGIDLSPLVVILVLQLISRALSR